MEVEPGGFLGDIRAGLTRENIASRFRAIRNNLGQISRASFLHYSILSLTLILASLVRLLPLRWGAYISEFDPYFNFNDMRQITANGWQSWYTYVNVNEWFPFGRAPVTTSYPGTSFTGTLVYQFFQSIGINISLYDAAVYSPILLGAFAVLVTYFFAKDLWGKSAGLFAALFTAFSSSLISRTELGFFRNEGVGVPTMILTFLFFMRAVTPGRSMKSTIIYSMMSSISLIYMTISWGSFRYAAEVLGLFALALVVLRRYTPRLFLAYGITVGFMLYIGTMIPLLGHTFLTESTTIALLAVMGLLMVMELARLAPSTRGRLSILALTIAASAGVVFGLVSTKVVSGALLQGKFLATVDPFVRNNIPLVASVAENRPSTWASLYLELGSLIILGVFGFFFAFQRLREGDVLLIIFGVTGFYFAASLVRLTLILAPVMATLAAITVVELGKPAMDIIQQAVIFPRRKLRFTSRVSREFSLGILLIILVLVVPTFINAVQSAYTPTTIASASLPVRAAVPDWLEALSWMGNNLPQTSVVFAWWDYGYWITVNTGLRTLSDNGTGNTTAIQDIATGFMLNETLAIQLMRQERVTHVAIFISYNRGLCGSNGPPFCGYGDDSKWYWMVRIGNGTSINTPMGVAKVTFKQIVTNPSTGASDYHRIVNIGNKTTEERITSNYQNVQIPTSNTVLGLLMRSSYPGGRPNDLNDTGPASPHYFVQDFASSSSYVLVYSVKYPDTPSMTAQLSPPIVPTSGGTTNITGTLTTSTGKPIDTTTDKIPVILEYSTVPGGSWTFIANVTATSGHFGYKWTGSVPTGQKPNSYILVRARWPGDPAQLLDIGVTMPQPLTFM
ncbi:MAG TPA: STT3 domain-containing protein [Candidatus Bathyarchaeia archaeon]|nr:STT3 domain-containing protein [Candidatus Bathyarchaeia archaeon]